MLRCPTLFAFAIAMGLVGCAALPGGGTQAKVPPGLALSPRSFHLTFQNGQTAVLSLTQPREAAQVAAWAAQGVYTNAPVYKQLPGVFLLVGKPRLAGQPSVPGLPVATPRERASAGWVSLVLHADGTAGPELLIQYGSSFSSCCEAPASTVIGKLVEDNGLKTVQRGDRLESLSLPR